MLVNKASLILTTPGMVWVLCNTMQFVNTCACCCLLYTHTHNCTHMLGTKNVAKEMAKISQGRVRDRGVTWFPEFIDKSKPVYMDCLQFTLMLLVREKCQNSPVLGHEELWPLCRLLA